MQSCLGGGGGGVQKFVLFVFISLAPQARRLGRRRKTIWLSILWGFPIYTLGLNSDAGYAVLPLTLLGAPVNIGEALG